MPRRDGNLSKRIYRRLLIAYPRSFRLRYGDGMVDLFRTRHARAQANGRRARLSHWCEVLWDLCRTASLERLDTLKARAKVARRKDAYVDTLLQDLRLSFRRIMDAPGFAVLALLIIGLGIGVNVAMYSIVETILFRPAPWERPAELVWIYQDSDEGEPNSCSFPAYRDIRGHENVFSGVAALIPARDARYLTPSGDGQLVNVSYATSSLFPVLGMTTSRGRWLDQSADEPGGEPVGVVSYRAWQRHFGSDPGIVGRTVKLSGASVTIIGIGPEGYHGELAGMDTDLWLSIAAAGPVGGEFYVRTLERREDHWFMVVGRMRPNVTLTQTQAAMDVLAKRLANDYPQLNRNRDITVFPAARIRIHPEYDAMLFPTGGVLLAVAGLVLLIACSNLANLLLARATTRGREIAIRLSMGASRWRLLRQLLTESTVLSIGGGALGVLFAAWAGRAFLAHQPPLPLPLRLEITLDARLLVFAGALSLFTGLVFGLVPAIRASRPELVPHLKEGNETSALRRYRWLSLRNALVSIQVATSIVLLVGAGLLIRSLVNAESVDLGFGDEGLTVLQADAGEGGYEGDSRLRFFRELRERLTALAGVEGAALTTRLPVTSRGGSSTLEIEGYASQAGSNKAEVIFAFVDPGYFETLKIPLRHGRVFTDTDRADTDRVAIVNETFARRYFSTTDAVNRRYRHEGAPDSWVRIVGVVGDSKVRTPDESATPMFFRPLAQNPSSPRLFVVARASAGRETLVRMMRQELRALDADVPIYQAGTMDDHVAVALGVPRAAAATLGLLGGLAVLLASMGLYAVVAFAVSRRTFEIAIRMALGASGPVVVASVMKETMAIVGAGLVAGLGLSLLVMPVLSSVLFDVAAIDPLTFGAVAVFMGTVAAAAAYLPARRAAHNDPVNALRFE